MGGGWVGGKGEDTKEMNHWLENKLHVFVHVFPIPQVQLTTLIDLLDLRNLPVGTRAQDFNEALFVRPQPLHSTTQTSSIVEHTWLHQGENTLLKVAREF